MKVTFYFDMSSGMSLPGSVAYVEPPTKMTFATRYKFTVEFPDPNEPDVDLGNVNPPAEAEGD